MFMFAHREPMDGRRLAHVAGDPPVDSRPMNRRVPFFAVALGLLLTAGSAIPVLAHAELVTSDPEAGSTVSDVTEVTLAFNEALKRSVSSFKLIGPDGTTIGTGTISSPRRMSLSGLSLGPGEHTVKWTAAGQDGHIDRAKFTFTVEASPETEPPAATDAPAAAPAAGVPVATATPASSTNAPTAAPTTSAPTAAPTAAPSAAPETAPASTSGTDVLLPIVGGLVIVGLVGALVLRRSRAA